MPGTERFTIQSYFQILTGLLGEPRRFFTERAGTTAVSHSVWFLLISSLLFSLASLIRHAPARPLLMGAVFTANGMGMALILAAFGYLAAVAITGKRVTFARFFSVYAFSAGVTMLAAWIPFFVWITEPWKWWLIATGIEAHLRLQGRTGVGDSRSLHPVIDPAFPESFSDHLKNKRHRMTIRGFC